MITQKRRFLYQPNPLVSVICWSWTLVIFLIGVIFWLEVTHFQWITLFFFILFALVVWAEIHFRTITIHNGIITVSRVINPKSLVIKTDKISEVSTDNHQIGFVANGKIYHFLVSRNSAIELAELIGESANQEKSDN
ncbi:EbsA family protein [Lentilactobacillus kribbianus]|uniref:EbsA family protein n=1 Tax=Lentilactobacillus kribbianus TaxID=2729622 RepID=UPI001557D7D2|nr:EbsA family protein [Lentilactobacillus kribbianus]